MNALCATRPAEWWDPEDGGARLAIGLCQVCPVRDVCEWRDPDPRGVIRAGIPYSEAGKQMAICPTCGYPQMGVQPGSPDCQRCKVPGLGRWRNDILRWHAAGITDAEAGLRLGATAKEIQHARRPRIGRAETRRRRTLREQEAA